LSKNSQINISLYRLLWWKVNLPVLGVNHQIRPCLSHYLSQNKTGQPEFRSGFSRKLNQFGHFENGFRRRTNILAAWPRFAKTHRIIPLFFTSSD